MKKLQWIGSSIFLALSTTALAGPCDSLTSVESVVECALESAPDMIRAKTEAQRAEALGDQASQRPNPEFSADGTYGLQLGDKVWNVNAAVTHTVEIGGKRSARIERADGEFARAQAELLRAKERTLMETLKILNRMRQISNEAHVLDEALDTFTKILKQYFRKSALGPEQQVSLSIFQLAESDYRLRRNSLEIETTTLKQQISVLMGRKVDLPISALPEPRSKWPNFGENGEAEKWSGSWMGIPRADLKIAQADLELARSNSWSNFRLGPSYQYQAQGPIAAHMWGANLTFDLPLFHMNGGGREVAHRELFKAEQGLNVTTREIQANRAVLLERYKSTVEVLSKSVSRQEMEKRHRNVESLFERGVISSSLVIEAHRQMADFTRERNVQELSLLEALWQLQALEGKLFEEYL